MQVGDFFPDLLFLLALLCIDGKKKIIIQINYKFVSHSFAHPSASVFSSAPPNLSSRD